MGGDAGGLPVKSRQIVWPLVEQIRSFAVPVLEALDGARVVDGALRDVLVVELDVACDGVAQVLLA